jgi:hypothetical protein
MDRHSDSFYTDFAVTKLLQQLPHTTAVLFSFSTVKASFRGTLYYHTCKSKTYQGYVLSRYIWEYALDTDITGATSTE